MQVSDEMIRAACAAYDDQCIGHGYYGASVKPMRAALTAALTLSGWRTIDSAPKNVSVLLGVAGTSVPVYCGRQRYGNYGEPQQDVFAWRCDSSGRFANPTHWMPRPAPPATAGKEGTE